MGTYLNPGNGGFAEILNSIYVDKTGLISLINRTIQTRQKLTCISRPRRFGKSYAAQMLCAYYDCSCDSSGLFDGLAISKDVEYKIHLNQYHVVSLDISGFISRAKRNGLGIDTVPNEIVDALEKEIREAYPELSDVSLLTESLKKCVELTGRKFIFVIDEWDGMIREARNEPETQEKYLSLLREWFKNNNFTPDVIAAVYMTGILPIKKGGSQSAISDFKEYSMIKPRKFGEYVGFTQKEVESLCEEYDADFQKMKQWYDGYSFREVGSVYNPNSVMQAIDNADFDSYWTETSASESLLDYISMDYDGLSKTVAELIGGGEAEVNTLGFANDLETFNSRDDVLTLLTHLGYLAYDERKKSVRIPNEEIRMEFAKAVRGVKRDETIRRLRESDQLIRDVIHMDEEAVAAQIEKLHEEEAVLFYNSEQSLRSVIKRAFFSAYDEYILFEELPAGVGFADVVYLPRRTSMMPVLVIELKWNKSAQGAISQIRDNHYPGVLEQYGGEILLVGISYEKNMPAGRRKHTCRIERYQ